MRWLLFPLVAAASLSAAPAPEHVKSSESCRDRITEVRDAAGQPKLDRSPAIPGQGYLIAAVDKRVDGCAVMQMHRQIDDLRPLPETSNQPVLLIPLKRQ